MKSLYPWCVILCLIITLSACGSGETSTDTPPPNAQDETPEMVALPTSPPSAQDEPPKALPGRILFAQEGTIWQVQQEQLQALLPSGDAWQPRWSPDGSMLVYVRRGQSFSDVYLADANGQDLAQLTANGSSLPLQSFERIYDTLWAWYPTWSPDGNEIVVVSQYAPPVGSPAAEYNLALYTMSPDATNMNLLYLDEEGQIGSLAYHPDGLGLAFTRASLHVDEQQIYWLDLATGLSQLFPGVPPRSYDPAFSPDGAWMAFAARVDNTTDIWLLPGMVDEAAATASEPEPQRLTTHGWARAPVFSPDGAYLAFLAIPPGKGGFELWVANVLTDQRGGIYLDTPRQMTRDLHIDPDSGLSWGL
ncbi:MAG: hypothetical protein HC837_13675 [Chloroflexaceae bacterium]|nr:hypothetical protein [Chloroflexaceae bacterium]